jgi:hypothetical protein
VVVGVYVSDLQWGFRHNHVMCVAELAGLTSARKSIMGHMPEATHVIFFPLLSSCVTDQPLD